MVNSPEHLPFICPYEWYDTDARTHRCGTQCSTTSLHLMRVNIFLWLYYWYSLPAAIREEIQEIKDGKYDTGNNVIKVRRDLYIWETFGWCVFFFCIICAAVKWGVCLLIDCWDFRHIFFILSEGVALVMCLVQFVLWERYCLGLVQCNSSQAVVIGCCNWLL